MDPTQGDPTSCRKTPEGAGHYCVNHHSVWMPDSERTRSTLGYDPSLPMVTTGQITSSGSALPASQLPRKSDQA